MFKYYGVDPDLVMLIVEPLKSMGLLSPIDFNRPSRSLNSTLWLSSLLKGVPFHRIKNCKFVWKNDISMEEHLLPYVPARTLMSSSGVLLCEPLPKEVRQVAARRSRAFSGVAPPQLWNELPWEVRLAPTLYSFRRQSMTFLFSQHFNSP